MKTSWQPKRVRAAEDGGKPAVAPGVPRFFRVRVADESDFVYHLDQNTGDITGVTRLVTDKDRVRFARDADLGSTVADLDQEVPVIKQSDPRYKSAMDWTVTRDAVSPWQSMERPSRSILNLGLSRPVPVPGKTRVFDEDVRRAPSRNVGTEIGAAGLTYSVTPEEWEQQVYNTIVSQGKGFYKKFRTANAAQQRTNAISALQAQLKAAADDSAEKDKVLEAMYNAHLARALAGRPAKYDVRLFDPGTGKYTGEGEYAGLTVDEAKAKYRNATENRKAAVTDAYDLIHEVDPVLADRLVANYVRSGAIQYMVNGAISRAKDKESMEMIPAGQWMLDDGNDGGRLGISAENTQKLLNKFYKDKDIDGMSPRDALLLADELGLDLTGGN